MTLSGVTTEVERRLQQTGDVSRGRHGHVTSAKRWSSRSVSQGPCRALDVGGTSFSVLGPSRFFLGGNIVDVKRTVVDVKGNLVDVKGNSVDVKGNNVDVKGNLVDVKGNLVDDKGSSAEETRLRLRARLCTRRSDWGLDGSCELIQ
eukprot:1193274-Prorocentrum_minimum.AAC.1